MRILVTGGAGRLGSMVVRLLAGRGETVLAFDLPQVPWDAVMGLDGVEAIKGDITDPDQVMDACGGVDGVVHLAALLPPRSEVDRGLTMRVNVRGTRNILEALEGSSAPLVFASSISTYGITAGEEPPIGEGHPLHAHNAYSSSKIDAEAAIKGSGVPHVILRIAPISVADLLELPETIPYRGDQRVEFVYVEDAAYAIVSALDDEKALGGVFNIAGGPSWQMKGAEYVGRFYAALGVEVEPNFSEDYTALDWYDADGGRFLGYQRVSFNDFLGKLHAVGEQLGLR